MECYRRKRRLFERKLSNVYPMFTPNKKIACNTFIYKRLLKIIVVSPVQSKPSDNPEKEDKNQENRGN